MGEELRPLNLWRKYVIDHHFFDAIDTEAKAYWLGFITADGCIVRRDVLAINLAVVDIGHLAKLNGSLSSDYRVYPGASGDMARWHAISVPIVRALGELGVTPRKSLTATPWSGPADLMRHYWRGMVDGDGGMSRGPGRRPDSAPQWRIYFCGTLACVSAFGRWASDICGSRAQPRSNRFGSCWSWMLGGNRMTSLVVEELYGNCSISLNRKQALADAILDGNRNYLAA